MLSCTAGCEHRQILPRTIPLANEKRTILWVDNLNFRLYDLRVVGDSTRNMGEFLHYWWENIVIGWEYGDGIFSLIETLSTLLAAFFLFHPKLRKHRNAFEEFAMKMTLGITVLAFLISTVFVASFVQHKKSTAALSDSVHINSKLQRQQDEKLPKLDGFINRIMLADEPGTKNSLVFLEVTIGNSGGSPSSAEQYELHAYLSDGASNNAEPIYFTDEYKMNFWDKGKYYLLDLKRSDLISERTVKAIGPGDSPRGWLAFRFIGAQSLHYNSTNIVLSFLDVNDKRVLVTNQICQGQLVEKEKLHQNPVEMILPGSENIFSEVERKVQSNTGWLPPELPPGCSNVIIYLGSSGLIVPRFMAEISTDGAGTKFSIKDLPDSYVQDLDKTPGYTPRQKFIWLRSGGSSYSIGGRTVQYPIHPVIISNRLYVEVQIPFSNEKHKLVMNDDFDPELPVPPQWDRNYSTNYFADNIVSGGVYAYEIVNELKNPVLQVAYSAPNEVHINGIFQVDSNSIMAAFWQPPQLFTMISSNQDPTNGTVTESLQIDNFRETLTIITNESIASFGQRLTNEFFRPIFQNQRAFFKYPSNRHLGEYSDWFVGTNRANANDVGKKVGS